MLGTRHHRTDSGLLGVMTEDERVLDALRKLHAVGAIDARTLARTWARRVLGVEERAGR